MLDERRALAIKTQSVAGTAETLADTNVIYAEDIRISPEIEMLARNHHLTTFSKLIQIASRTKFSVSFKVPMYGAASAGAAPFWSIPLLSCGFAQALPGGVAAQYLPLTESLPICTIKVFIDGVSFRIRDARGNVSCDYAAGQIPMFNFTFNGIWDVGTDTDAFKDEAILVGAAFPAFVPKPFRAATISIDGSIRSVCDSFKWDMGNRISVVPDASVRNYKRVDIVGREPKGELDQEGVLKATYDFHRTLAAGTAVALLAYVGADDGGSGAGAASHMVDTSKNWITNQWAGYYLLDKDGDSFPIASNTATDLTVTGTPDTGLYVIYTAGRLVRTSIPKAVFSGISDTGKDGQWHHGLPFAMGKNATAGNDEIELYVL